MHCNPFRQIDLNRDVRKISGVKFSKTHRCWYVENGEGVLNAVMRALESTASVDDSALRPQLSKPVKNETLMECPSAYVEQLDRMRYSDNTKKIYINFFRHFIDHFRGTPLDEITDDQVNAYMRHLLVAKKISSSTQNQVINAIKFYYERVKKRERRVYALERPIKETKLPKVLSEEEVTSILTSVENLKHKTMLWLVYAAGLLGCKTNPTETLFQEAMQLDSFGRYKEAIVIYDKIFMIDGNNMTLFLTEQWTKD